ncbi:unnamed protein product [Sphagnum troendelagicum]|uniref:RecA family profile 1 domain-containing protein n=1 Tax=Sphagnum troendelagicum TaxID=128251 RepID=A0ABP0THK7_9BRYO
MPKLIELGLPSLTPEIYSILASQGIISVEDFMLSADISKLEAWGSGTLKEVVAEILHYLECQRVGLKSGLRGVQDMQAMGIQYLPTGCDSLDAILEGGLREGTLTELVGASATGKTQLCMQVAASVAYKCRALVAYIDTCHSFSSIRVAHMVGTLIKTSEGHQGGVAADELGKVLKGILKFSAFDIYSALSILHELHASISNNFQAPEEFRHLRLLIVDSASSLISPILGGNQIQGHALMVGMGAILRKLAIENHLAVLITNHTVGGEFGQPKPALGESWKRIPDVRLLLTHNPSSNASEVAVIKHSSIACNKQASFCITKRGLQSAEAEL